ncbi:glycosyltransferase family 4 protein [bacterium]|nr:glycosyltransferase family 4 protein [bacterium]
MIKRALAERKIVKALDSFNPQILIGVGGYNEQKLFQKWTKKQGALYIPIIVAKWPVPDNPVRKIIWKRGISAITDPDIPVIFARGEFLKHYLAEEYNIPPDRIKVYWPKYPQELFTRTYTSPFEENKFNILFAGRFSREKGVMLLPDILKLLIKDLPKTKLTLIGDGQLKNELRKKLREVSEEGKSWRIVGFLPQKEIISYYKNCDALIVPSLCEGFGKVVYEGLMCGAWPVASDVDNIGYLIRDGIDGSLVSQIEPNEFVKKLIERNTQGRKKNINNQYFKKMQNEYPSLTEALDEFLLHIEMGHNDK